MAYIDKAFQIEAPFYYSNGVGICMRLDPGKVLTHGIYSADTFKVRNPERLMAIAHELKYRKRIFPDIPHLGNDSLFFQGSFTNGGMEFSFNNLYWVMQRKKDQILVTPVHPEARDVIDRHLF